MHSTLYHLCTDLFLWQDHAHPMTTPTRVRSRMADTAPRAAPMAVEIFPSTASVLPTSEPRFFVFTSGHEVESGHGVVSGHAVESGHGATSGHKVESGHGVASGHVAVISLAI